MAQRGQPSIAHEYNKREECIHCGMYRNNVEAASHVCKPFRERESDKREAARLNISLLRYQMGRDFVEDWHAKHEEGKNGQ
jgi:hypothetical protein